MILELERGRKFSGDNRMFVSELSVGLLPLVNFMVLKLAIFFLRTSNYRQLPGDSSSTEALYCLNNK